MTFTMSFSDFLMTSMTFVIWNQSNLLYMLVARPMQRSPLSEWGQMNFEVTDRISILLQGGPQITRFQSAQSLV